MDKIRIPMFIKRTGSVSEKISSEIQELKELALSFCILEAQVNNRHKRANQCLEKWDQNSDAYRNKARILIF